MPAVNPSPQPSQSRSNPWPRRLLWLLLLWMCVEVLAYCAIPVRTPMTVPIGSSTIALDRRPLHIFLAEYDRELVVLRDGRKIRSTPLFMDTGGAGHMNVYQVDSDNLVAVDRFNTYSVRLSDGLVQSVGSAESFRPQGVFIGGFDKMRDKNGRWSYRFIPAIEREEIPIEPARLG